MLQENDPAYRAYTQFRQAHWDAIACKRDTWKGWGGAYHKRLREVYCYLVDPGQKVLEIGCGTGELLVALEPAQGVGVDFSSEMIQRATQRHPGIEFIQADAHNLSAIDGTFDIIILSDAVNDLWDVQAALEELQRLSHPQTRLIINLYSRLWQGVLSLAQATGLATPVLAQNWLTVEDVSNLLNLAGFEVIRSWHEILWPLPIPLLSGFLNRFVLRFWPFYTFTLSNFVVARLNSKSVEQEPSVSVVIPARNEAGNIPAIFERTPKMGSRTELIFVEGHSHDDTSAVIEREMAAHPDIPSLLLHQTGIGKADAMRLGFNHATGDILMILDADLTVPPENLPRFYQVICSRKGEFVNGVRLVYPMERDAMRLFNFLGNKFFSLAFSWLLGQPIKDTLCGTKVLWRSNYNQIVSNRSYFGDFDPFGDFDLIFGAAKLNCKIVDMPVRYRERIYGTTNISRWKHGWLLLKMVVFAAQRLKFI